MQVKLVYPEAPSKRIKALPAHATALWRRAWWTELLHNVWRPAQHHNYEFEWRCTGATFRVVDMDCDLSSGVPHAQSAHDAETWLPLPMLSNMQDLVGSTHTITMCGNDPFGLLPTRDMVRSRIANANPTARMTTRSPLKGAFLRALPAELLAHVEHNLPPLYGWSATYPEDLTVLDVPVRFDDICGLLAVPQFEIGCLAEWDAICWDNRHTCFAV